MNPPIPLIYTKQLQAYSRVQQAAVFMRDEVRGHLTSVVAPILERLADDPNPSLDSADWLELMAEVENYKALKERATNMEEAATRAETLEVRPGLDHYKAKLGLPLDSASLPDFWKKFEAEEGLVRFALTLMLIVRLKISPAKFATKGTQLLTTNTDTIFLALLDDLGTGEFTQN